MSDFFACRKFNLLAIDRGCKQHTVRAHVFLMLNLSACLSQPVVTVVQVTATLSRTDSTHTRGSRSTLFVSCPEQSHLTAQCHTLHLARGTCTPSLSSTLSSSHPFVSQLQPCADLRPPLSGALAEPPSFTEHDTCAHDAAAACIRMPR